MKGTEKQIAWAQEIAERVIKTWEALHDERKDCEDDNGAEEIIGTYRAGEYGATERYYIYDHLASGDTFDRVFDADSYEAALDVARSEWDALSASDKARRSEFLVGVVSAEAVAACEDGMDSLLNYMTNVFNLKEEA